MGWGNIWQEFSLTELLIINLCFSGHNGLIDRRQCRERNFSIFETVARRDSNPGSLDCESGILLLKYRTLHLSPSSIVSSLSSRWPMPVPATHAPRTAPSRSCGLWRNTSPPTCLLSTPIQRQTSQRSLQNKPSGSIDRRWISHTQSEWLV